MARVFPFRPYRYSATAGPLQDLVTQPYDKISPEMQARYLTLSPHNLVRVILGPSLAADNEADNVYTRAAAYLEEWIASGVLIQEETPGFFGYFQEFQAPDTGERLVRKGFIGLGAVEAYSAGVVHRHEQTLSGPKKDRMELLRHTRAHFGQIFMLYPDPRGEIDIILDEAAKAEACAAAADEYGTVHRLWRITDATRVSCIQELMASKKLLIADGHHRYETALAFRGEHPELADAGRVMMTFVNMHAAGLRILATHRVVEGVDATAFLEKARSVFAVAELRSLEELGRIWAGREPGAIRIGAALRSGELYLLRAERQEGTLDVSFLHDRIIGGLLGIDAEAVRGEKHLRYVRGVEAAVEKVREGPAQIAFLLEPTAIEDVARVAFSGGVMPQKSTDFYPKLLSGLTIYRLEK